MTAPPCLGFLCSSSQTRKGPSWCMCLNSKTAMLPRHGTSTACTSSVWLHEVAHDRCVETASADTASIGSETANIGSYGHTVLCGGTPGSNGSMLCAAGALSSFFTSALLTLSRLRALAAAGVPPPTNASCEWRRAVHSSSLFFSLMAQSHNLPPTLLAPVAVYFAPLRAIQRIRGHLHPSA